MRKGFVIGASFLAVLVIGGCGGGWMRAQTETEIKALIATLEANGGKVSHGTITTSLLSRAVTIDTLSITPSADASTSVNVGRIHAEGISPAGRGSARRVIVQDLWIGSALVKGLPPLVKAPRIELTDFEFAPASATMAAGDPVLRAVSGFAGVSARSIVAPSIETSFEMAAPQAGGTPSTVRIDYTDVRVEGVADGRIARARIGKGSIGDNAVGPVISGNVEGVDMTELDVLPMFGIGLERRKPEGRMFKLQGRMTFGAGTFKTGDGGEISIGRANGAGLWIDPSKLSYERLPPVLKQAEAFRESASSPHQHAVFAATLADIYDGLRFDSAVIDDAKIKGPAIPEGMTVSRLAVLGLDSGKLGEFRLEGLATKVPGKRGVMPLNIGLFVLEKLDLSGVLKVSTAALADPQAKPNEILSKLLPLLQGLELNGVEFADQQSGQPARLDKSRITWGGFINGLPTQMKVAIRGRAPLSPDSFATAVLVQNGVTALDVDLDMAARFDDKARQVTLDPFVLAGAPLGHVSAKLGLTKVPPEIFTSSAPQAQAAALAVELGELELNITDGGIVALARKVGGPSFANAIVAGLRQQLSPSAPSAAEEAAVASVERFLSTPGQTLTVRLKPKAVARLAEIAALVTLGGATALFGSLEVTSDVRR